ncbi:ROK family transcriptional regulator [Streptomyces pathocidini]|uniref:ROK family transcriptional regulator n=1 Tax=Streptomyces pathocidini TaxID=1650571 RepID=UPI0033F3E455
MTRARIAVTDLIREPTRAEMFALVLTAGPISRTGLSRRMRLAPSTVTRLLPPLLEHDFLRETDAAPRGRGRPQRMLEVNPDRHVAVGIKIGPAQVSGVITNMAAQVLARAELPIPDPRPDTAFAAAAAVTRDLLAAVPHGAERALGVGVGVGGHVDSASGVCRYSAILDWQNVDVAGPLAAATGMPVTVNNDVNTLAVAEHWFGEGRDVASFAVVTVGPGIGCGLVLNGELFAGSGGIAGELGHLPQDPAGPMCGCGSRGCLEALASDRAVLRHIRDAGPFDCPTIGEAVRLARHGPTAARAVARAAFAEAGTALGRGLAGLCNLLNLQKIIVAGEGAVAYDLFGPAMQDALAAHAFSDAARDCALHVDPVHHDLWARGAASLAIRQAVDTAVR